MSAFSRPLITWTKAGLYCEAGGFHIDPHRAVEVAVVTHAHSDHARRGAKKYITVQSGVGLLKARLGKNIAVEGYPYREPFFLNGVKVSFHSAGHILGSAQVRVEFEGEVWVASGDYKRDPDPSCDPFEPVVCDTFITEATFGTPKYQWDQNATHGKDIFEWWRGNAERGRNCILFGYSLGKAQRILAELAAFAQKPVLIHSTITELTECYRAEGWKLAETIELEDAVKYTRRLEGELILAPPSILKDGFVSKLGTYETAFASGWMQGQGDSRAFGGRYDRGFVMSDHADWAGLNRTIEETRATRVFVQHRDGALVRHLRQKGIEAHPAEALEPENFAKLPAKNLELF